MSECAAPWELSGEREVGEWLVNGESDLALAGELSLDVSDSE